MRIGGAEAPQPPTLSVLDDRLDELSNLSLEVGHGLGVESRKLLSALECGTVVHSIGSELITIQAVVPCLTCRMLRLMKYIHAVSNSLDGNTLDSLSILEQGHLSSLAVVVNDDGSTLSVSEGSVELRVLHHVLAECVLALTMPPIWVRCVLVASLLSESLSGSSDVLNPNGL